jgi:polysaccharide biosynthesis/export protein
VKRAMERLVRNPLASVVTVAQRQMTYTLVGGVERPGPYFVARSNYRLLEALTVGGKFDEGVEEVYVIRQVALTEEFQGAPRAPEGEAEAPTVKPPPDAKPILDIIDEIAPPRKEQPSPAAFGATRQPPPAPPKAPVVNLPEDSPEPRAGEASAEARWVFVNGKWTQVVARRPAAASADGTPSEAEQMVTQRVIRIPLEDLLAGKQAVNIVVRAGDVIRVPTQDLGTVVIGGQVARPGVYGIPSADGLTLMSAIRGAAGGYSAIAIPERIDLTRRTGKDRETTIMLDGAAIARREQPDIYLKPNDQVIVGTNFWGLPLAVIRNGFRASYGWGFVLDRNLSNDIFGPEPRPRFQ